MPTKQVFLAPRGVRPPIVGGLRLIRGGPDPLFFTTKTTNREFRSRSEIDGVIIPALGACPCRACEEPGEEATEAHQIADRGEARQKNLIKSMGG
jgi:hypothetical protein